MRRLIGWRMMVVAMGAVASLAVAGAVFADSTLLPSMFGGGGGRSSSANFVLDSASGQAGPIGVSGSTNFGSQAGFFFAAACAPGAGAGDPDGDLDSTGDENAAGTDPCDRDTDGDGCADGEETQPDILTGGERDPLSPHDFYDVNRSKVVDAADIGLVRSNFNSGGPTPPEDVIYDRSAGAHPWAPGPPNNMINAQDIGLVRTSFNHSCLGAP